MHGHDKEIEYTYKSKEIYNKRKDPRKVLLELCFWKYGSSSGGLSLGESLGIKSNKKCN